MNQPPDFEQLIGADVEGSERARLRRVHSLLVQAGPPPEISPSIEAGPTLAMTMGRRPKPVRRRVLLLAAALAVVALAFLAGFVAGNGGGGTSGTVLKLTGTPAAPSAFASLQIEPVDPAGNWPMRLSVKGLPELTGDSYYEVFVMRNGRLLGACGTFRVSSKEATVVQLNAPYHLRKGDTWIVTRQRVDNGRPGVVVLRPIV